MYKLHCSLTARVHTASTYYIRCPYRRTSLGHFCYPISLPCISEGRTRRTDHTIHRTLMRVASRNVKTIEYLRRRTGRVQVDSRQLKKRPKRTRL